MNNKLSLTSLFCQSNKDCAHVFMATSYKAMTSSKGAITMMNPMMAVG